MEIHHSEPFFRLRHWLRDGGFKLAFDKVFMYTCCGVFAALLSGGLTYSFVMGMAKQTTPPPVKAPSHVIDRHNDPSQSRIDTHLRFTINPQGIK